MLVGDDLNSLLCHEQSSLLLFIFIQRYLLEPVSHETGCLVSIRPSLSLHPRVCGARVSRGERK